MVLSKARISPQYICTSQLTVTILDVINPAHFVVKESPTLNASSEAKNFLEAEESMQKYYESIEPRFFQLPLKDSIIVVLYDKKFYRARVIRILNQSPGHLFKVYLVDYGTECSVPRDCIYEIERDFQVHPFQAVDLKLLGIEPISLVMNTTDLTMSYGPVTYWDPSAEIYVHDLQKGMCNAYMEIKAIDEQHIHGSLFVSYNDNRIKCINDELVVNKFARFNNSCWEKVHKIEDLLENISANKSVTDESLTPKQLNPRQQMSSSASPSKTEPEFKDLTTMLIRSDGKIVAKSSFGEDDASVSSPEVQKDNFKPQVQKKSEAVSPSASQVISPEQKVQKKSEAVSPSASDVISPEQKARNATRLQRLQASSRKRYSAGSQSHLQDTVTKSAPFVDNTLKENLSSNATLGRTENSEINVAESENMFKDSISSCEKGVNSSSQSSATNNIVCTVSEVKSKPESVSQVKSENLRTFQKLQQRARLKMKLSAPACKESTDLENNSETFQAKGFVDSPSDSSSLISSNSEQQVSTLCTKSSPKKSSSADQNPSTMSLHQQPMELEKVKVLIEESEKLTQSSVVLQEPNILEGATGMSEPRAPDLKFSDKKEALPSDIKTVANNYSSPIQQQELSEEIACNKLVETDYSVNKSESLFSVSSTSSSSTTEKIEKSPVNMSKDNLELEDLDFSPMGPKSNILNELLVMSDSDDLLLSSLSNKKDESFCDKDNVQENYIELSTQLKHSDPKLIAFNELSLWEKQKVPALLIGVGLTRPVLNVEEAEFSKHIMHVLKEIKFYGPSCIQSVIWPCLDKNRCMVAVAPPHSGKTVSYVLPLVSAFTEEEVRKPHDNGPSTIILCSSWLKAQAVYDLFHFFLGDKKMNIITLCTDGGHYRNRVVSLINSCDILIATPYCLLQFLKNNSIKFGQLENFILDDSTALMNKHKKELKNILLSYINAARRSMITPQLMLFAERWNKNFHVILDKMMSNPLIFFTSFLESALFAKVSIFAHVCEEDEKKSSLLGIIKDAGKVVICTTNKHDAVDVHHFIRCEDQRTFLVNEEMEHYIADEVIKDWKSIKCMATSDCLVITDQALIKMCISNADCLVHYDIPQESRLQFGNRFSCIAEHFQKSNPTCVSHILVTESDRDHAPQIVKIVENSGGSPSKDLIELSQTQDQVESNSDLLCPYFKAFGFCKERLCKDRHVIDAEKDKPQVIPHEGDIQGLVTQIVDASHYYVRLLKYLDPVSNKTVSLISTYAEIGFQLRDFYSHAPEEMKVKSPIVGGIYVLAEENKLFYRIKVLKEVNCHSQTMLPSWKVLFLDEGWIKYYEKLELYELSDQIKLPEPIAVEIYVCNITTPDSCFDWNPQTSQLVSDLIKGKEIRGKVALCLGKTLWLDPIALVLHLSNTNEYVNLFKLNQKLIECGHVKQNKNHLVTLRQACAGKIPLPRVAKPGTKKEDKIPEQTPVISYAFLECNTYEDVYVSSVVSPHQLYVQRAKFVECLDNLLDKINEQVSKGTLKKAYTLYKGLHCIAPFYEDDRYYRAVITDIVSYTEAQLFYVDFGDSAKAPRNKIYCLPAEFLLLPFQAIECELAGIAAAHGGWTDSSVDALMTLTRDEAGDMKILQLQAYSKSSCYDGGNHYAIDLWFNEKNLSEQLLQAGFGVPTEVPMVQSPTTRCQDISSDHSDDEEFNLNEKDLLSDEDMHPDDRNAAALFYNYVAEMVMQANNIIPKPGVTISEVSSDDQKCVIDSNETTKIAPEKVCNDLVKLLPKLDLGNKEETPLETCSNSLKPLITWSDTREQLSVLINLKETKIYQLVVTDEGFNFNTIIAGVQYSADEKLYDKINSFDARKYQTFQGINIVAKKHIPFKWPRLTKEKKRFLHIKYDLINIEDSDSDEESANVKKQDMRHEYAVDEESSSTDEEEKHVELWKDFVKQKDPFSVFD